MSPRDAFALRDYLGPQLKGRTISAHALTHAHPDHFGSSHKVCTELGIPLWAPANDAEAVEHGVSVSDDLYRRMRVEFSEKEMIEIATTAGLCHLINRFHGTFGTELESRPGDFTTASVKR